MTLNRQSASFSVRVQGRCEDLLVLEDTGDVEICSESLLDPVSIALRLVFWVVRLTLVK